MATLSKDPAPGHWKLHENGEYRCADVDRQGNVSYHAPQCPSWQVHDQREQESLEALIPSRVWQTPVADGYAIYYITSQEPLEIAHVPFGDAYRAHPALIRGITAEEIRIDVMFRQRTQELAAQRKATAANHQAQGEEQ